MACNRCVHVCPIGIDIRQGLQIECIGCTACIDACDEVMGRLHRPPGLIRYDSQAAFAGRPTRWLRPRTLLYAGLLLAGAGMAAWSFSTITPVSLGITRMPGAPYFVDPDFVRDEFFVRLINKQSVPTQVLVLVYAAEDVEPIGLNEPVILPAQGEELRPLVLRVPRAHYTGPFDFTVTLSDTPKSFRLERKARFLGPDADLLQEEKHENDIRR